MSPRLLTCAVAWVWLAGCAPKSAEQVSDRFVDLYFVEIDQKRALALTAGLAHAKLEEELGLVAEVRQTYDPEQAKPSIFYARKSAQVDGDRARLSYDLTIRQGRDETARNALISAEKINGAWKVSNFMVAEGSLLQRPASPSSPPAPAPN
jgi:hypothetical protein